MEKEKYSIFEVKEIVTSLEKIVVNKLELKFLPLAVKTILRKNEENGLEDDCVQFKKLAYLCYENTIKYLQMWTKQFEEFSHFT